MPDDNLHEMQCLTTLHTLDNGFDRELCYFYSLEM